MDLVEQLRRDEGVRHTIYTDSLGIPTIGVGRNCRDKGLSDAEIDFLLANDIAQVRTALSRFSWYTDLDPVRQGALENMAFNMGWADLLHFPAMLHCLATKDWAGAASAALDSLWAKQVGPRADRLARQLRTGEWQ